MPASVTDHVTASLLLSLSSTSKCNVENGDIPLEERITAASKRAMHSDIEYEVSTDTYQSSVLQGLKAKYSAEQPSSNGVAHSPHYFGANKMETGCPTLPLPSRELFSVENVKMQWPQRCSNGSGLINAGNSCYLNSVLQALFHIPPMFNWLMEGDSAHQKTCTSYSNHTTECIVCCMANTLRSCQMRTGNEIRPSLILARLRSICRRLIPGQQEDAMEFLRYLFEAMEKNYLQRFNGLKMDSYTKETTPLNQIFGGYIRTDVTCLQCRGVSTTFQHFLDLTLDIARSSSIEIALENYFSQERLEGDNSYRCEKCRRKVPASKQFFVERIPNVLCIQLKRFNIEGKKISKGIHLSERISLQKYLSRPRPGFPSPQHQQQQHQQLLKVRPATYRLHASVNHLGHTAQSGHYTALAYTPTGLYHFDDSSVQRVWNRNFSTFCSDVYLLMYVLESPRPEAQQRPGLAQQLPSATSTSQSLQASPSTSASPRPNQIKMVSPSPFVPNQVRRTPNILNHNRKSVLSNTPGIMSGPVCPTKSPTELIKARNPLGPATLNQPSKLVSPSSSGTGATTASSSMITGKSSTQSSPVIANYRETLANKLRSPLAAAPSSSSLVPYSGQSSGEEEEEDDATPAKLPKLTISEPSTPKPTTNGWTITPTTNGHADKASATNGAHAPSINGTLRGTESVKKLIKSADGSKFNGCDGLGKSSLSPKINQDASKKCETDIAEAAKRLNISNSEKCNVRSTSSSWEVSTVVSPVPPEGDLPPSCARQLPKPESSWVVTSASTSEPTSAEQSPGTGLSSESLPTTPSPNKQPEHEPRLASTAKRKYRRRSSSNSSSSSSSSSESESGSHRGSSRGGVAPGRGSEVWVERTKETIFGSQSDSRTASGKRPYRESVSQELRKMGQSGYGGASVNTWNGGRSHLDRQAQAERCEARRNYDGDADYDPLMDGGRRKKMKTHHGSSEREQSYQRVNHFQQEADLRRHSNGGSGYDRGHGGRGYGRKNHGEWRDKPSHSNGYHRGGNNSWHSDSWHRKKYDNGRNHHHRQYNHSGSHRRY